MRAHEPEADDWAAEVEAALNPHGIARRPPPQLVLDVEQAGFQPRALRLRRRALATRALRREGSCRPRGTGRCASRDPVQGVPLGEFLIGYVNGHHEKAPGPVVPGDSQGRPVQAGLAAARRGAGLLRPRAQRQLHGRARVEAARRRVLEFHGRKCRSDPGARSGEFSPCHPRLAGRARRRTRPRRASALPRRKAEA